MKIFDYHHLPSTIAGRMKLQAVSMPFTGLDAAVIDACTAIYPQNGSVVIFTFDIGYHSSGWWKNPDYNQCWHLSLSFRDTISGYRLPRNKKATKMWLDAFFTPNNQKMLWVEPPYTKEGKESDAWHYRLFVDKNMQPIIPRGEVYSKEFTEAGWKSFSEIQAELEGMDERQGRD